VARDAFEVWPPPRVSEVDPKTFGVAVGLGGAGGLNPYVRRDIDSALDEALKNNPAVVVSTPRGAGASRTVYEALNRVRPDARLLIPIRAGEFDPDALDGVDLDGPMVLWLDKLGAHWDARGARLLDAVRGWLDRSRERWFVATVYDGEPDVLGSEGATRLPGMRLRLESALTDTEVDAMRRIYGHVGTTELIGFNPPTLAFTPDALSGFSNSIRDLAGSLGSAEVTASRVADEIRQRHGDYAGRRLGSVSLDTDVGVRRPVSEWLSQARACYDPEALARSPHKVINGRLVLAALAALDPPLADALGEVTLAELAKECEVHPVPPQPPAREHVRWLVDEPVGLDGDELGRRAVATALHQQLRELVRDFPGRSFLVHIDGAWGAGKSTLLRLLRESVQRSAEEHWLIVSYDAWRQSRVGPPWLTLLQAVRTGVRSVRRNVWSRALFWLRERTRLVSRWQWIALFVMAAVAAGLAALLIRADTHPTLSRWGDVVKLVGGLVPVVGAVWLLARSVGIFISLDSRRSARAFLETRSDPMEDLTDHFHWLLRRAGRPVLLLVDDLDRCTETFVVEMLDAVQKLMRDDRSDRGGTTGQPGPGLLVVVAADGRWVRNSYDNAYASLAGAVREPGVTVGTLFLEKLFQLTVPVPRLSEDLKAEYLRDLLAERPAVTGLGDADPQLVKRLAEARHDQVLDVLASAPAIERVKAAETAIDKLVVQPDAQRGTRHALEPYAPLLDPRPRAMKRFVMAYSLLRAVRTAEGSVVGVGPLALWIVLQTRWPMLASYLQELPDAVRLFSVPVDRIPASTPPELVPLFTDPSGELRAVMNHPDGPLDARTIRACSGQELGVAG
jgi:hypothetical protein